MGIAITTFKHYMRAAHLSCRCNTSAVFERETRVRYNDDGAYIFITVSRITFTPLIFKVFDFPCP